MEVRPPEGTPQAGHGRRGQRERKTAVPDVCDLVLDEHEQFRRRFADLDEQRAAGASAEMVGRLWDPLGALLERHADAEEELFYPVVIEVGVHGGDETDDAVNDHNEIREAVRRAADASAGSEEWWQAVLDARARNSDHIAEEEREAIPDLRTHLGRARRDELGAAWLEFADRHAGARGLSLGDTDPDSYLAEHGDDR